MALAQHILKFVKALSLKADLPQGIGVMNPFQDQKIYSYCTTFYTKYYSSDHQRTIIMGINPGRFGGGLTGIPFTDPIKLEKECDIPNDLPKKSELSADFIYKVISSYGGKEQFYDRFYFSSVCPLGFTKDGKNLNYYDVKELEVAAMDFIVTSIRQQINFGLNTEVAYCLGDDKNYKFLTKLNKEHQFFKKIIPLSHPRFIMQYRRKKIDHYINDYLNKLRNPESFVA